MRISALVIGCLALCMTSCFGPAPGKGRKANAGYRAATPIIAALEKFNEDRGHYPAELSELVPAYLPDSKKLLVRGKVDPLHSPRASESNPRQEPSALDVFWYQREADTYILSFSYVGPGMNNCWYESKTRKWGANGYY